MRESKEGNNLEGQGETILERKKGKRTGTPGKQLSGKRGKQPGETGGNNLCHEPGNNRDAGGNKVSDRMRKPDLRVGGPNPPRAQGSQPTQEGRRNCAHFILDSTKFGTLYLYRTDSPSGEPCKEINPLLDGLQEVKC